MSISRIFYISDNFLYYQKFSTFSRIFNCENRDIGRIYYNCTQRDCTVYKITRTSLISKNFLHFQECLTFQRIEHFKFSTNRQSIKRIQLARGLHCLKFDNFLKFLKLSSRHLLKREIRVSAKLSFMLGYEFHTVLKQRKICVILHFSITFMSAISSSLIAFNFPKVLLPSCFGRNYGSLLENKNVRC